MDLVSVSVGRSMCMVEACFPELAQRELESVFDARSL
jgi:hypothetical protein